MRKHALKGIAGAALFVTAVALAPLAAASTPAQTVAISAMLNVTGSTPPNCRAGVCTFKNHGTGTMTPYGSVTFTTRVTFDVKQPPCGPGSQWVNRILRTIRTDQGDLVLHEAGLECPQPGVGPRVEAVWAVAGAKSTGIFHDATGSGTDVAYPLADTAAPQGTITLVS